MTGLCLAMAHEHRTGAATVELPNSLLLSASLSAELSEIEYPSGHNFCFNMSATSTAEPRSQ